MKNINQMTLGEIIDELLFIRFSWHIRNTHVAIRESFQRR